VLEVGFLLSFNGRVFSNPSRDNSSLGLVLYVAKDSVNETTISQDIVREGTFVLRSISSSILLSKLKYWSVPVAF
jgi:hypothetical protein